MKVTPLKTEIVTNKSGSINELLKRSINSLTDNSVVAVTSKIVALCEGRVVDLSADKHQLVVQESDYYIPDSRSGYDFSIVDRTMIMCAGIDESNANGMYVLWPANPQSSANSIREYLSSEFKVKNLGVIITDSTARPLHFGTEGVAIAFSGFVPNNSYVGKPDIFGRKMEVSILNIADSIAAAAVLVMGEGREQTPIAVVEDLPFVKFTDRNPTEKEISGFYLPHMDDDLFRPFLASMNWQKGERNKD